MANVKDLEADDWEADVLASDKPVVVDFWHPMCGWCNKLNPIFNQLPEALGDRVKFVKVNILQSQENQKLAMSLGVLGTPTMKFFCEGRDVDEIVGFRSLDRLVKEIEEILEKKDKCLNQSTPLQKKDPSEGE